MAEIDDLFDRLIPKIPDYSDVLAAAGPAADQPASTDSSASGVFADIPALSAEMSRPSTFGVAGRAAERGILPALATMAGTGAGAAVGAPAGPLGATAGGLALGIPAGYATAKAQSDFLEQHPELAKFLGQDPETVQADIAAHPWAALGGEAAPMLATGRPSLYGGNVGKILAGAAGGAAVGGLINTGQNLITGDPLTEGLPQSLAFGALFNKPWLAGSVAERVGAGAVGKLGVPVRPGNPLYRETPSPSLPSGDGAGTSPSPAARGPSGDSGVPGIDTAARPDEVQSPLGTGKPKFSSTDLLSPYATGNAQIGGASSVEGVDPFFSQRIAAAVAQMPPELQARFQIISGFRDAARQHQVNPGVEHSHHTMGLAVDIGKDPAVIDWINKHPETGIGFPLNADPKEINHLEPLDENGHRIAGVEHMAGAGTPASSAETALGRAAAGLAPEAGTDTAGDTFQTVEAGDTGGATGAAAPATGTVAPTFPADTHPVGTPAAKDEAAAAITPLSRVVEAMTTVNPGVPVTVPRLSQIAGLTTRAEIEALRDSLVQRGLVTQKNGRYVRADTVNDAAAMAPTDHQAETLPQTVKPLTPAEPALRIPAEPQIATPPVEAPLARPSPESPLAARPQAAPPELPRPAAPGYEAPPAERAPAVEAPVEPLPTPATERAGEPPAAETPPKAPEPPAVEAPRPEPAPPAAAAAARFPELDEERSGLPPGYSIEHNTDQNTFHLHDPGGQELEALSEPAGMADVANAHAMALGNETRLQRPESGLTTEREALQDHLYRIAKETAPSLRLETFRRLFDTSRGGIEPVYGSYDRPSNGTMEHIVRVAMHGPDPVGALHHELVHYFRGAGMFKRGEWEVLSKQADKWRDRFNIDQRYPGETVGVKREEAIAEAAAAWHKGELQVPPGIRRVFQRIVDFFHRTGNFLRGRGYQTAEDVFRRMRAGDIGRRAPGSGVLPGAAAGPRYDKPEDVSTPINQRYPKVPGVNGLYNPQPTPPDVAQKIARGLARKPDVGAPKNAALRLAPGVYLGKVNLRQWIQRTETHLTPEELTKARAWYREALPVYTHYFGDKGPAMLGAWLTANVNATPSFAQLSATRVLEQYLNRTHEVGPQKQGGLAHEKLFAYWDAILSGDMSKLGQEGSGQKIYDFIDSALGKKTRTFYGDDPRMGAPAVADVHSLRDMGFVDQATLNWVREKYGEKVAAKLERDSEGLSPGEAQYEWSADKMRDFADRLNKMGYDGGNWTPAEVQAVGWMTMSKMLGRAGESPAGAIEANVRNLSYELDPGEGAPFKQRFPQWDGLSDAQKTQVTREVLPHILDEAKSITGAHEFARIEGLGGWRQYTNPAFKSRLVASPEVAGDMADIIGYLGQQTKVFGYRWENSGNRLGVAVYDDLPSGEHNFASLADPEVVHNLWQRVAAEHPDLANGFSPSIHDGRNGLEILLDKGGSKMAARVRQELIPAIDRAAGELGLKVDVQDFRAGEQSREHDWTQDPGGGSYLSRLSARYGPAVRDRLELFNREKLEPAIDAAIARTQGRGAEPGAGAAPAVAERGPIPGTVAQPRGPPAGEPGGTDVTAAGPESGPGPQQPDLTTRFQRPIRGVESDQEFNDYQRLVNQGDLRTVRQKSQDLWTRLRQDFGNRFKQGFIDSTHGREVLERELNAGQLMDPKLSPTEEARRANYTSSMVQVALGMKGPGGETVGGPLRFNDDKGTFEPIPGAKPLMAIAEPIWQKGLQVKTALYLMARRAQDLMAQGRENLVRPSDLQYLKLAQQHPEIAQFAREWDKFNEHLLDFSEWGGTLSKETRAKFGKNYVPFYRIDENGDPVQAGAKGMGQHMRGGFRRLTGGEEKINDLWDNMFHNTEMIMGRNIRNHANKSIVELAAGVHGVTPLSKVARDTLKTPQRQAQLRALGVDPAAAASRADTLARDLYGMQQKGDPRLISFMADGVPQYYHIDNPLLMRSLTAFGPQAVSPVMKILGMPAHVLSRGVTLMPDYMVRNLVRDTLQTQALTPSIKIPGMGAFKGFVDAYRNSPDMVAMMAAGGGGGHGMFYGRDISPLRARLEAELPQSLRDRILDSPKKLLEAYEHIGKAGEMANRLAIFNSLKGQNFAQAAKEARDILPFAQRGDSQLMQTLISLIPFLNARVQGLNRMYRGFKENPASLLMRGGLLTAATAALWLNNKDDERYKQLPDYARQNYLHLMGPGFHYMLPQPFEHGAVFSSIPEIMMNYMNNGSSSEAFNAAMAVLKNQLNFNPIPQAFQPAIDLYSNRSSFTGAPIVSDSEKELEPGLQVSPQTSRLIAELAGKQNLVSPAQLDYAIKAYTGGLGTYGLAAADALAEASGVLPPSPSSRLDRIPVISSFYRQGPESGNRDINDFYDLSNSVKQLHNSINLLGQQGRGEEARALALRSPMDTGLYQSVETMAKSLADLRKSERAINAAVANGSMTPEQGREMLDRLTEARNQIGARGARQLNRLHEGLTP